VKELIAFPLLAFILAIQMAITSRIPLLGGYADLMLVAIASWSTRRYVKTAWHWAIIGGLFVGITSALPVAVPVIGYLLMVLFARLLVQRIWQAPLLALFVIVFFGAILFHLLSFLVLRLSGSPIPLGDALSVVTLPSLLINLFLALPAYPIFRDLAMWVYDEMEEE